MRPSIKQQLDFWFDAYFGIRSNGLDLFVSRAYRDMNRTLRGINQLGDERKSELSNGGKSVIKGRLELLRTLQPGGERAHTFDTWHRESCTSLVQIYAEKLASWGSQIRMTHGQAQEWFNMTIKYIWISGGEEFDYLNPWFPVAHVPVDEVILVAAERKGVAERPCRNWSSWNEPERYLNFQCAVRQAAASALSHK